jgi:hypothetical protein
MTTVLPFMAMAETVTNDAPVSRRSSKTLRRVIVVVCLALLAAWAWTNFRSAFDSPSEVSTSFFGQLHQSIGAANEETCGRVFPEQRDDLLERGWTGKVIIMSERIVRKGQYTSGDTAYVEAQLQMSKDWLGVSVILGKSPGWCVSGIKFRSTRLGS